MVDYKKAVTSATDLIIRDTGAIEFLIDCRSTATWFGSARPWSGRVNSTNVGGGFTWATGGGTRRIAGPWTVSKTQDVTFAIGDTKTAGMGGPASFTVRITRALPNAPTGLTITRVSDSQQTLNWTRASTYTSVVVQRSTDDGAWQQVGVASGNAYTFTDKSTSGNHKYEYRVAGVAASGQSGWSGQATVYTSPSIPSGIKATRDGDNIVVSASSVAPYATGFDVQDGATVIASAVSLPYTHVAPDPAVPHTYTVRAVRTSPDAVASGWSAASNTVQLISPPNAPAALVPNGAVWASDTDVTFSWAHNPVDSSAQSAFELQWRLDAGSWTTVAGTTVQSATVTIEVGSVDWQVRTKGAHPDFSPWSPVASFTVIDRPGVAVIQPADSWDASILVVGWTWFQAQGRPQSGWRFELLDAGNSVIESRNGSGATAYVEATTRLHEGTYTARIQAATGEVWSVWAVETFTVTFTPPGQPVISGVWDEEQGGVQLAVAGEEYGSAVPVGTAWYATFGD
jgi:hypothetical protein